MENLSGVSAHTTTRLAVSRGGNVKQVLLFLWNSRTTVFGYIQVIIGVLAASDGVFGPKALKIVILTNGILTAVLGHYNNLKLRQATANEPPQP